MKGCTKRGIRTMQRKGKATKRVYIQPRGLEMGCWNSPVEHPESLAVTARTSACPWPPPRSRDHGNKRKKRKGRESRQVRECGLIRM